MTSIFSTRRIMAIGLIIIFCNTAAAQNPTVEFNVNGLKVLLRQTQKETLVMTMYFRGGTSNYQSSNAGIEAMALSGAVECGTSQYTADQFNDETDEYGLHLAGVVNDDYGAIKLACISRYADKAWNLFSAAIASPIFETQKFNLLKEQKIGELKASLSSPDARLTRLAQEFAFAGTPYAINPEGTPVSLQSFTRDAVKDYYNNVLLNKNRMFLVVAGNITKEDLEKKISTSFVSIPAKPYQAAKVASPRFAEETAKIEPRAIATNYIAGIVNAPLISSDDYPAFRLGVTILHSYLYDVIRLEKQLSYAPYASMSEGKISYVTMYASTTQPGEVIASMRTVLSQLKSRVYSEKLIDNIRKGFLLSYTKRQELMTDIVDLLGDAEIMGDWKLGENLVSRMSKVNAENVRAALAAYATNIKWAYIGDKAAGEKAFAE